MATSRHMSPAQGARMHGFTKCALARKVGKVFVCLPINYKRMQGGDFQRPWKRCSIIPKWVLEVEIAMGAHYNHATARSSIVSSVPVSISISIRNLTKCLALLYTALYRPYLHVDTRYYLCMQCRIQTGTREGEGVTQPRRYP